MLFRSGYAKRYLARRLQQSPLRDADVVRIETVLRRAVLEGTGLEEYRAYAKLAAHLVESGRLPDFEDWLEGLAEGAILTLDRADGEGWRDIFIENENLSEQDKARLGRVNWFGPSKWGTRWPWLDEVVRAGKRLRDKDERVRRNACPMLRAVLRRRQSRSGVRGGHGAA